MLNSVTSSGMFAVPSAPSTIAATLMPTATALKTRLTISRVFCVLFHDDDLLEISSLV